jgi:hypothetical protein
MKKVTLDIPDSNYELFLAVMQSHNFFKECDEESAVISEETKATILERKKNSNPATRKNWDDVKNTFKLPK